MFVDVSSRASRAGPRGVLHRRHRRMRVRPGEEHARDGSQLRNRVHPRCARASRPWQPLDLRELRRRVLRTHRGGRSAIRGGCRSLHQLVRRLLVLARRVRAHPAQGIRRFGPGVHPATDREG